MPKNATTRKTTPIWNAVRNGNAAELTIYAPIENEESWWYDSVSPKGVMRALDRLGTVDEIVVRINSPGGSVFAGLAIYETLKQHKARVIGRVDGIAASAASIILMAADEIIMGTGAMIMVHNPWSIAQGDAEDFRGAADMLDKVRDSMVSVYKDRTGKDEEELKAMLKQTTWLTADEAIEAGFADQVDRKMKVSASIQGDAAVFNGQRFDLRAFASLPNLPRLEVEEEQDEEHVQPAQPANEEEDTVKDLEELKAKHPDIYRAAVQAGAEQERARHAELDELLTPSNAAIIQKAKADGASAAETAVAIIKAENDRRKKAGADAKADADESGANDVDAGDAKLGEKKAKDAEEVSNHAKAMTDQFKRLGR